MTHGPKWQEKMSKFGSSHKIVTGCLAEKHHHLHPSTPCPRPLPVTEIGIQGFWTPEQS